MSSHNSQYRHHHQHPGRPLTASDVPYNIMRMPFEDTQRPLDITRNPVNVTRNPVEVTRNPVDITYLPATPQITQTPDWDAGIIRDLQEELKSARAKGLNIPPDKVGSKRKGKWSKEEREALLGWLSDDRNYARVKTKGKRVWLDLAQDNGLFCGTRTWSAIKGQWEDWKKKYDIAKRRVESTGEGQKDEEQWASMELGRRYFSHIRHYNVANHYLHSMVRCFMSELSVDR